MLKTTDTALRYTLLKLRTVLSSAMTTGWGGRRASGKRSHRRHDRRPILELLESRQLLAAVSGSVFEDLNGDGVQNQGENGAVGVMVTLADVSRQVIDTATTDAFGAWAFSGVVDGDYQVSVVLSSGELQTTPGPITGPDEFGRILDHFPIPASPTEGNANALGLTRVGSQLYLINRGTANVPSEMQLLTWDDNSRTWQEQSWSRRYVYGLSTDGDHLWMADRGNNQIVKYAYDAGTDSWTDTEVYSAPAGATMTGLAWEDSDHVWITDSATNQLKRLELHGNGTATAVQSFASPFSSSFGLDYRDGLLWATGTVFSPAESTYYDTVMAIDTAASLNGQAAVVQSFHAPTTNGIPDLDTTPVAVVSDQTSLWIAQWAGDQVVRMDLGQPRAHLVTVVGGSDATGIVYGTTGYGHVSGLVFNDHDLNGSRGTTEVGLEGWRVYIDQNHNHQFDAYERVAMTSDQGVYSIPVPPGAATLRLDVRGPGWASTGSGAESILTAEGGTTVSTDFGVNQNAFGPVGPETLIVGSESGTRGTASRMAMDDSGRMVVVWSGDSTGIDQEILAQFHGPDGKPIFGTPLQINQNTAGTQSDPVAAAAPNGSFFAIGWTSNPAAQNYRGAIRLYSALGQPLSAEIAIGPSGRGSLIEDIEINAQGTIAVLYKERTYQQSFPYAADDVFYVQRYDAAGAPIGRATKVADPTTNPTFGEVALFDDGAFVVSWRQNSQGLVAQRFNSSGRATGPVLQISDLGSIVPGGHAPLSAAADGSFAVAWQQDNYNLYVNHYSWNAAHSTYVAGTKQQLSPRPADATVWDITNISMNADGLIGVTWLSDPGEDVYAQRLQVNGNGQVELVDASSYIVNTTRTRRTSLQRRGADVAVDPAGRMTVSWIGAGIGSEDGVYLQRFAAPDGSGSSNQPPVVTITSPAANAVVSGNVLISANAMDADGQVTLVEFFANGALIGFDNDGSDGWSMTWDSRSVGNGLQALTAAATDNAGDSGNDAIVVDVQNNSGPAPSLYVSSINSESRARGKKGSEYRIVIQVREDSNSNGIENDGSDTVVVGAQVTVTFAGQTFTGVTDSNGIFATSWLSLSSGTWRAEVTSLSFLGYQWNPLDLLHDSLNDIDGDGYPDLLLTVP